MIDTKQYSLSKRAVGAVVAGAGLCVAAIAGAPGVSATPARITVTPIGTYESGLFAESAAEIVAHDPITQRLFVVNAKKGALDVLDITDPSNPTSDVTVSTEGGGINSVAIDNGIVAVAVQADIAQENGSVVFFDSQTLETLGSVEVGALPDMLTFTPDGSKVVVANEGEPDGYCVDGAGDPEGSISIIDVSGDLAYLDGSDVRTAGFDSFNDDVDELRASGVRIFGPNATVAQDLEPEYVTVDATSTTAWVSLQENNALAIVDLATATVTDIVPLGFKDHSIAGNGLDASDKDDAINITTWPVSGMFMPDAIDSYQHGGRTYIVTANEGDARDYDCYSEEARIEDLDLDPEVFLNAADLQDDTQLGRLKTTTSFDTVSFDLVDGVFEAQTVPATRLHSYGARSFSIWDARGGLVFDSADDFEQITSQALPSDFNSTNDENDSFDNRSDDKGPEPEGVVVARLYSKTYAFIGLERVGGVMVYDVTNPRNPMFSQYINTRVFTGDAEAGTAGDLGPEGLTIIEPEDSPNGRALLVVGSEVSGTTSIFQIDGPGRAR